MPTKRVITEVDIDVDIDLEDFDTNDLISEIEARTNRFLIDNEDSGSISDAAKDEIYNLYRDYLSWDDNWMSSDAFANKLKNFFEGQLGILVH